MGKNRRDFIRRSSAWAIAAAAGTRGPAAGDERAEQAALPIIDTHQHLWDLKHLRPRWIERSALLRSRHATPEYLRATRGLNIVKAIYLEIALPPEEHREEVAYVTTLCRSEKDPTVAAVIGGRPDEEAFVPYIREMASNHFVKGVRQVLHGAATPPGFCLRQQFVRSLRLLGELDRSFDLCMRAEELSDGVRLVDQCPETRFIVDHCGNADPKAFLPESGGKRSHDPDQWRRDMAALAKRKNVVCKISGVIARVPRPNWNADQLAPIVNHCLDQFGPDRVVFGSDWPVCDTGGANVAQWVKALKEIVASRPIAQQRRLFHDNARRVYRL